MVLSSMLCHTASAAPPSGIPNVEGFGYSPTTWRQWPWGEHPEQTNPQSVGTQVIPAPQGQEELPPVTATPPMSYPGVLPPTSPNPIRPQSPAAPPSNLAVPQPPATPTTPVPGNRIPENRPNQQGQNVMRPPLADPLPSRPSMALGAVEQPRTVSRYELPAFGRALPPPATETSDASGVVTSAPRLPVVPPLRTLLPENPQRNGVGALSTASRSAINPAACVTAEPGPPATASIRVEVPNVAIGGYCPVELVRNGAWVRGDPRCTAIYQGAIYQFSGIAQRQQFTADPTAFVPVASGSDVVRQFDEGRTVPGHVAHCAIYKDRLYMFSGAATQAEFNANPGRYATAK
jgi:YHS domain-containing protein